MKEGDEGNSAAGENPKKGRLSPPAQSSVLAGLSLSASGPKIQQTNLNGILGPFYLQEEIDKDNLVSGEKAKKGGFSLGQEGFSVKVFTFSELRKEEKKDNSFCFFVAMTDMLVYLDEGDKDASAWFSSLRRKLDLRQKVREDILRKILGQGKKVKEHPEKMAIYEFVESVRALEEVETPWVRERWLEEKKRCLNQMLEYIREALKDLDYEGLQVLGRMFEKAVTQNSESHNASDLLKVHQAIEKYCEKMMDGMIAAAGYLPRKRHLILPSKPFISIDPTPSLGVSEGEGEGKMGFYGSIPNPTRQDLNEFLAKPDHRRRKQIVRAAKALGYPLRRRKSGLPPL